MEPSAARWQRLADLLKQRRAELGFAKLTEFANATGVNYKTLQRIEGSSPRNFGKATLYQLDHAYGYQAGSIQRILDGGDPLTAPFPSAARNGDPVVITAEQLGNPIVRIILDIEGSPKAPLSMAQRIDKARETHQLIAAGEVNPTVQQVSDPMVQAILGITGATMADLWDAALRAWDVHREVDRRDENRNAG